MGLALLILGLTALAQLAVFIASSSVALLADLIHNFRDAATAVPLGIAFALRSARAERFAGLAVVFAIFVSACVAGYEAVDRLVNPKDVEYLGALAAAGALGFAGNWGAAIRPLTSWPPSRQARARRRRCPRPSRRLRVPCGRRLGGGRGARASARGPAHWPSDYRRDPPYHAAVMERRPLRPRPLKGAQGPATSSRSGPTVLRRDRYGASRSST